MAVRERHGSWQADFKLAGWSRVRETFRTEAAAEAYELAARAAHKLGKPLPSREDGHKAGGASMTLAELHEECRKLRWASKKSGEHLAWVALSFVEWVGGHHPVSEVLTLKKINEYVTMRRDVRGNAYGTINRNLSAVSVMAAHALSLELIPKELIMPWQTEGGGRLRYYTQEEEFTLLGTLTSWGLHDVHDFFVFLVDTGARVGEACKLLWGDIRGRSVSFIDTKAGTDRGLTLTPRAQAAIQRLRARYGQTRGPFMWVDREAVRRVWNRLRKAIGWMGDDTVIHTFRHTCCSRLVIAGVDLLRVQKWMGHSRIETTLRYAHLAPKHLEVLADVLTNYSEKPPLAEVAA